MSKEFKPNTTQTPNAIFDLMAELSDAELRVVMVIIRKTYGWHKDTDKISNSQFTKMSGLGPRAIQIATKSLSNRGLILKKSPSENGGLNEYMFTPPCTTIHGGGAPEFMGGVYEDAPTKLTNQNTTTKNKSDAGKASIPALSRRVSDMIGEAHKHLTGSELVWAGQAGKYGKAQSQIIAMFKGKSDDEAFTAIRQKAAAYVQAAKADEFLKKQGVTPISLLSNWNKVHFKAKAGQSFGGKTFPDYRSMSPDQIKSAFAKWNKDFTTLDVQKNVQPASYEKFIREANGYAPALAGILIEEVHGPQGSNKT